MTEEQSILTLLKADNRQIQNNQVVELRMLSIDHESYAKIQLNQFEIPFSAFLQNQRHFYDNSNKV